MQSNLSRVITVSCAVLAFVLLNSIIPILQYMDTDTKASLFYTPNTGIFPFFTPLSLIPLLTLTDAV